MALTEAIILLTSLERPATALWGLSWIWGTARMRIPQGLRFERSVDFEAILSLKRCALGKCRARNFAW